jgi:uncharacterized protein YjbI with pentapeptide repeats
MRMDTDREHSEPQKKQSRWGFRGMTVRDWLQLLIVPLALVVIGFVFTMQQDQRQQRIENQRAKAERELAEQRAQDEALQAYLDQMGSLLLEKDLRASEKDSEVRTLARARTATVIQRLDPDRNRSVIGFLKEAGLLAKGPGTSILNGADLSGADLRGANLWQTDLRGANLSGADLNSSYLRAADLSNADLSNADLSNADLSRALLIDVHLHRADLSGADLTRADLTSTSAWTRKQLLAAKSLKDATMPNGQKYEEWLKDKEGR